MSSLGGGFGIVNCFVQIFPPSVDRHRGAFAPQAPVNARHDDLVRVRGIYCYGRFAIVKGIRIRQVRDRCYSRLRRQ